MGANSYHILIIKNAAASRWQSCHEIKEGILSLFDKLPVSYHVVICEIELGPNLEKQLTNFLKENLTHVFFIDEGVFPFYLIPFLEKKYLTSLKKPKILFYQYGDCLEFIPDLKRALRSLKLFDVKILVASSYFKRILSGQMRTRNVAVEKIGFYIERKHVTADVKKKWLIKTKEKIVFTYAGRLSSSKNVDVLVEALDQVKETSKIVLFIAGSFDDIQLSDQMVLDNNFYTKFVGQCRRLSSLEFYWLGNLNGPQLESLYELTDYYISLSSYKREDFGVSPYNAIHSGCRAILTQWRGYTDFEGTNVEFVKMDGVRTKKDLVEETVNKINSLKLTKKKKKNYENLNQKDLSNKLKKLKSVIDDLNPLEEVTIKKTIKPDRQLRRDILRDKHGTYDEVFRKNYPHMLNFTTPVACLFIRDIDLHNNKKEKLILLRDRLDSITKFLRETEPTTFKDVQFIVPFIDNPDLIKKWGDQLRNSFFSSRENTKIFLSKKTSKTKSIYIYTDLKGKEEDSVIYLQNYEHIFILVDSFLMSPEKIRRYIEKRNISIDKITVVEVTSFITMDGLDKSYFIEDCQKNYHLSYVKFYALMQGMILLGENKILEMEKAEVVHFCPQHDLVYFPLIKE